MTTHQGKRCIVTVSPRNDGRFQVKWNESTNPRDVGFHELDELVFEDEREADEYAKHLSDAFDERLFSPCDREDVRRLVFKYPHRSVL